MKDNKNREADTQSCKCPGCGNVVSGKVWDKNGYRFQSLDCIKCGVAWGRIVDRDGTWHVLWPIGPDGQRIWAKPPGVKA